MTVSVSDGSLADTQAISVTVTNVNEAPVAVNDSYSATEGIPLTVGAPGVLGNDTDVDGGTTLTAVQVTGPTHAASFTLNANGSFNYTATSGFVGTDSFTYRANDGALNSNTATVTITVASGNTAPTCATPQSGSTNEDTTLNGSVVCTDAQANTLSYSVVTQPTHGTLSLNADGSFSYTPAANYNGPDSFTFKANDGSLDSNSAVYNITVTPVNDAPVASNDSYGTNEDTTLNVGAPGVLGNDSDIDSASLTTVLVTGPSHGTLTLNANGIVQLQPGRRLQRPRLVQLQGQRRLTRQQHGDGRPDDHRRQRRPGRAPTTATARTRTRRSSSAPRASSPTTATSMATA